MPYTLTLASGELGSVVAAEADGVVSITATANLSLGGGAAKGAVTLASSSSLQISALQAMNLGLGLLSAKFPSMAAEIAVIQAALDAELATL